MKELNENQIKALNKLNVEIQKDIEVAVEMAKYGKLLDLIYFIYSLKTLRLQSVYSDEKGESSSFLKTATNVLEEANKYIIQLLVKYSKPDMVIDKQTGLPVINFNLTQALTKQCTMINSKYEGQSLIQLFDVELLDKDAKKLKIDMKDASTDMDVKKFFDYFLRVDRDNDIKKNSKQKKDDLIKNFKDEYEPVKDLFLKAHGVTVDEFCDLILWFLNRSVAEIEKAKDKFEYLKNGNVQDQSLQTMLAFIPSFIVEENEVNEKFDAKYHSIIDMLTFNKVQYDEKELKFHLITRSPLIKIQKFYIVSPDLLLDSLFTNIHYSLLESSLVKEDYKARQATHFLDKIVAIAKPYGFVEERREFDLYDGSIQIGDIDLILKDEKDNYILIEAKNHALPLDVYFKDIIKTKNHLADLQKNWETKVIKRVEHLKKNHKKYSIPSTYIYIVVSRFPEIIAHYSDLLVLSTNEFQHWLKKDRWSNNFDEIIEDYYKIHEANYSKEDLHKLSEAGLIFGKFAKE